MTRDGGEEDGVFEWDARLYVAVFSTRTGCAKQDRVGFQMMRAPQPYPTKQCIADKRRMRARGDLDLG